MHSVISKSKRRSLRRSVVEASPLSNNVVEEPPAKVPITADVSPQESIEAKVVTVQSPASVSSIPSGTSSKSRRSGRPSVVFKSNSYEHTSIVLAARKLDAEKK